MLDRQDEHGLKGLMHSFNPEHLNQKVLDAIINDVEFDFNNPVRISNGNWQQFLKQYQND